MKNKSVLFSAFLILVLAAAVLGQTKQTNNIKDNTKKIDISEIMGKPVYELTVDSLCTKIWILTQMKYGKIMKTTMGKTMNKMKETNKKMDKATKDAVVTGTHYFIFDVTNINSGKEFADTSAKVEIVSPTKIVSSVNLQPMKNHFGGGITLAEKGAYLFTINLNVGSGYKTSQFKYEHK